jgi:replicative superfamily II helicase
MFGKMLKRLFGTNDSSQAHTYTVTADYECIPVPEDLRCKGVEKLNPLQSCFMTKYNPDNNCVVVGKLGSGKSLIAFIACNCFLHIGKRAVFTAPMRELTRELYELAVGIFGRQLVGLYNGTDKSIDGKVIVVATPEGYLSGLRGNREWATSAELLVVDEGHNLCHPSRGASLDAALTMFRLRGGKVLIMSATFPQSREVSEHLNADLFLSEYERTKIIRKEIVAPDDLEARVRPKVLTESMIDTGTGHTYNSYSVRLEELRKLLAKEEGASVIVFVPLIIQGHCLSHALGAPFHWRGADEEEKRAMMAGFRDGRIKTIISTDTLGQGINTPCDATVIFGGRRGGYLLDSLDVNQKEGRGGRNKDRTKSFLLGDQWGVHCSLTT